jgi:Spy/CpxP family protein refolding chaperone
MKRNHTIPVVLIGLFLIASTAQAQVIPSDQVNRLREEERALNLVARGAWWTNNIILAALALSDDQKSKIGRVFENHSRNIMNSTGFLEKEEMQLARLLEAESIDHVAVLNQTNRVIQSRGEVERETAAMTLEMREQLTRDQWMKLQSIQTQLITGRRAVRLQSPSTIFTPAQPGQRQK